MKPLSIIFKNCLQTGTFPNNWRKSNVVPIHKRGDKQLLQNYRPVSLLPICSKIFEKIIFNPILDFLDENSLLFHTNLDFIHQTHVKVSYYSFFMTSMLVLIKTLLLK